jgi:hypothetical protein
MVRDAFDVRDVDGNIIGNLEEVVEIGDSNHSVPG